MKASVWSSYFYELSPEEMVKAFSSKGWSVSELSDDHGRVLLNRGNPEIIGKEFKSFAEGNGFSFPQGHLWLPCDIAGSNHKKVVDKLKSWIDLYNAVGVKNAVLHPGGKEMIKAGCEHEKIMEVRVQSLREITEYIKGTEMTICLENMHWRREVLLSKEEKEKHDSGEKKVTYVAECDHLLEIIEAAECSNLGICLDTGHVNMIGGDLAGFIRKAGKYLKALHITDNEGSEDQHIMPYGRGTIPWGEVVSALKDIKYKGLFNFEIPGENRCPLPVRLSKLDYIKEMAAYMLG